MNYAYFIESPEQFVRFIQILVFLKYVFSSVFLLKISNVLIYIFSIYKKKWQRTMLIY